MKIKDIKINGFKRLVQFSLTPDGKSVEICGENGEGKSSVIDGIWMALTGKDVPGVPMNRECIRTDINIGLTSGHTVEWSISPKGNKSLKVCGPDGEPVKAPQTFLDNLIGNISFDPFDFVDMQPAKQKAFLQSLLKIDFAPQEAKKQAALAEKRDADAEATAYEKQSIDLVDAKQCERIDTAQAISDQAAHAAAVKARDDVASRLIRIQERADEVKRQREDIAARIQREREESANRIAQMEDESDALPTDEKIAQSIEIAKNDLEAAEATLAETPDCTDVIANAEAINRQADAWARKCELVKLHREAVEASKAASAKAQAAEKEKEEILMNAKFPVKGLSFSVDGVLFNGLPFDKGNQCMSDILRVGVAIAVAQNPALKIVRIKDGSLLSDARRKELLATLAEYGFQAFVERVTDEQLNAIVIEEA